MIHNYIHVTNYILGTVKSMKRNSKNLSVILALFLLTSSTNATSIANASAVGKVVGQVLLSPTCPVEKFPPEPGCAPKPYRATIKVLRPIASTPYKKITTSALGKFTISLPPGGYILRISSSKNFPDCNDVSIKVIDQRTVKVKISCDTGIR